MGRRLLMLANADIAGLLRFTFDVQLPVWARLPQAIFAKPSGPQPVRHLIGHAHRRLAMKPGPGDDVMISGGWLGRVDPGNGRARNRSQSGGGQISGGRGCLSLLGGRRRHRPHTPTAGKRKPETASLSLTPSPVWKTCSSPPAGAATAGPSHPLSALCWRSGPSAASARRCWSPSAMAVSFRPDYLNPMPRRPKTAAESVAPAESASHLCDIVRKTYSLAVEYRPADVVSEPLII